MQLEPLQSIVTLFAVLALVGAGVYLRWAKRQQPAQELPADTLPYLLDGRTAVARQLYGQHYGWGAEEMAYFDGNETTREFWLVLADVHIGRNHRAASTQ